MTSIAFVIPAWRRYDVTSVCLRQLARTCVELRASGYEATAVVIANDLNLDIAQRCGFATIERANKPLGRKFNDGLEYAGRVLEVDFAIPFGSDNWIQSDLVIEQLPKGKHIGAHRWFTMVHQDGDRARSVRVAYDGGDGARTIPMKLLRKLDYRPADEDRERAIDTSIFNRLRRVHGDVKYVYRDVHQLQFVSLQSSIDQLNSYDSFTEDGRLTLSDEFSDHWDRLSFHYPVEAIDEARAMYERRMVSA